MPGEDSTNKGRVIMGWALEQPALRADTSSVRGGLQPVAGGAASRLHLKILIYDHAQRPLARDLDSLCGDGLQPERCEPNIAIVT
jgi:hypothetical protein